MGTSAMRVILCSGIMSPWKQRLAVGRCLWLTAKPVLRLRQEHADSKLAQSPATAYAHVPRRSSLDDAVYRTFLGLRS